MANDIDSVRGTYVYQPLDLAKQQIRLITLHVASSPKDDVVCDIRVFDMETAPRYVTLSYTWGPPKPTAKIHIGDTQLEIRQNLYDFLQCYRNDFKNTVYLWIDQICISQAHTEERTHQVQLMARIYTQCLRVIVWLGYGARTAALALLTQYNPSMDSEQDRILWLKDNEMKFESARTLFRNEYFSRLWIIQEIMLPPEVWLLCGDVWMSFDKLAAAFNNHIHLASGSGNELGYHKHIVAGYKAPRRSQTLRQCVTRFARHKCEDPRDKVYGLMGLVEERDRLAIDYNKTKHEVFLDVMMALMKGGHWNFFFFRECLMELIDLSEQMELRQHRQAILALMRDISNINDKMSSNLVPGAKFNPPITAMGFEAARSNHTLDRWWYEYNGTRYYRDSANYRDDSPGVYVLSDLNPAVEKRQKHSREH